MSSAAALRELTPSLLKAEVRWLLTLLSVTTSLRAISALEKSITTIASTCRSRGESGGRSSSARTARGTTHWPAETARSVGSSVSVGTGSAIGLAGVVGGDLDEAPVQQIAAEGDEVLLHDRGILVVLGGHPLRCRANVGRLAEHLEHVSSHRVQAVVLTRLEVEDHRLGHEGPVHH